MKKILALFALLALLAGCSAEAAPAMYIEPAKLNEEEEAVAKLLGADTDQHLFDVVLDGTAKTVSVNIYELVDGAWEPRSSGGGMALTDLTESVKQGRMAFGFQDLRGECRQALSFGKDLSVVKYGPQTEEDFTLGRGTSFLSERTEIFYGQEIPLAEQILTSGGMVSYSTEYFFQPEAYEEQNYEHVYALTVMFSQEPLS